MLNARSAAPRATMPLPPLVIPLCSSRAVPPSLPSFLVAFAPRHPPPTLAVPRQPSLSRNRPLFSSLGLAPLGAQIFMESSSSRVRCIPLCSLRVLSCPVPVPVSSRARRVSSRFVSSRLSSARHSAARHGTARLRGPRGPGTFQSSLPSMPVRLAPCQIAARFCRGFSPGPAPTIVSPRRSRRNKSPLELEILRPAWNIFVSALDATANARAPIRN